VSIATWARDRRRNAWVKAMSKKAGQRERKTRRMYSTVEEALLRHEPLIDDVGHPFPINANDIGVFLSRLGSDSTRAECVRVLAMMQLETAAHRVRRIDDGQNSIVDDFRSNWKQLVAVVRGELRRGDEGLTELRLTITPWESLPLGEYNHLAHTRDVRYLIHAVNAVCHIVSCPRLGDMVCTFPYAHIPTEDGRDCRAEGFWFGHCTLTSLMPSYYGLTHFHVATFWEIWWKRCMCRLSFANAYKAELE